MCLFNYLFILFSDDWQVTANIVWTKGDSDGLFTEICKWWIQTVCIHRLQFSRRGTRGSEVLWQNIHQFFENKCELLYLSIYFILKLNGINNRWFTCHSYLLDLYSDVNIQIKPCVLTARYFLPVTTTEFM